MTATHKYEKGGTYKVVLIVDDMLGTECSTACAEKYLKINTRPVANAGGDIVLCNFKPADEYMVRFKGSGSDADGDALLYTWTFGDGESATGSRVNHVYAKGGNYKAALTVDDGSGTPCSVASESIDVKVMKPPMAKVSPKYAKVCLGEPVTFDGSSSFVEDGQAGSYAWDFGDGTKGQGTVVTHKYEKGGKYYATLSLTDGRVCGDGMAAPVSTDGTSVAVNSPPVAKLAKIDPVCVDTKALFDATGSYDPDGDSLVYMWDFGDGTKAEGNAKESHVYKKGGNYTVKVTVSDGQDTSCSTAMTTADVKVNTPPVADVGVCTICCVGMPGSFDATPSHDPDGDKLAYTWDFGDGSTASGAKVTHTYDKSGKYKITLKVDDNSGTPCGVSYLCFEADIHESPVARPVIR